MNSWVLTEDTTGSSNFSVAESLFYNGNGYVGVRGSYEEVAPATINSNHCTFLNAVFEQHMFSYPEKFPGYADYTQSMVSVIDGQSIGLKFDTESYSAFAGKILSTTRTLDLKEGITRREVHWRSDLGKEIKLTIDRMASFQQQELFIIALKISSVNFSGNLEISSKLIANICNTTDEYDPRIRQNDSKDTTIKTVQCGEQNSYIITATQKTDIAIVCSMTNVIDKSSARSQYETTANGIAQTIKLAINAGEEVKLTKYLVYTDSRRYHQALDANLTLKEHVVAQGYKYHQNAQLKFLQDFWQNTDISIIGDDKHQQAVRYNIFSLLQSIGRDGISNISAKGLSGEGYEGHYFWDTEIYVFPFLLYTNPELAKNLLMFRYNTLNKARNIAKEMSHPHGALFPWRTIDGDECSGFFPAGRAQYHINADVAYSIITYYIATEDSEFMHNFGAEILFEVARVLFDTGHFDANNRFHINEVTGPDEYSCCVDNNYYTNILTKFLFKHCASLWQQLPETVITQLTDKINISSAEISVFDQAAQQMHLPFNQDLQINCQDDSFLNKKAWNFSNKNLNKHPLLMHHHPLVLYRHQVCKQADVVLANLLVEEESDITTIKNNFAYYEKITTHDSSLSTCIYSIMASRLGLKDKAYDYFLTTSRLDLDDLCNNTKDGLHMACMAGSWLATVFGFAGMRVKSEKLHFYPALPKHWQKLTFNIKFKHRQIAVSLDHNNLEAKLITGEQIEVYVHDEPIVVA